MRHFQKKSDSYSRGAIPVGILIFVLMVFVLVGADLAYIYVAEHCIDTNIVECLIGPPKNTVEGKTTPVEATGSFSFGDYGITVSLVFPLEGGQVTGSFKGTCNGSISGNYAGGNGGTISGKAGGNCMVLMPASGSFSGTVQHDSKTVPISGSGSALGISGDGSMTLNF